MAPVYLTSAGCLMTTVTIVKQSNGLAFVFGHARLVPTLGPSGLLSPLSRCSAHPSLHSWLCSVGSSLSIPFSAALSDNSIQRSLQPPPGSVSQFSVSNLEHLLLYIILLLVYVLFPCTYPSSFQEYVSLKWKHVLKDLMPETKSSLSFFYLSALGLHCGMRDL